MYLSNDEPANRGSWFDKLTMSVLRGMALATLADYRRRGLALFGYSVA